MSAVAPESGHPVDIGTIPKVQVIAAAIEFWREQSQRVRVSSTTKAVAVSYQAARWPASAVAAGGGQRVYS